MITTFERKKLSPPAAGSVVSIGMFDGVHLGHQAILRDNVAAAAALGAVPTVVTFRRHPKRLLLGKSPRTLTTLEHRLELFQRAGIGHTVALSFDESLRALGAEEFTREITVEGLGVRRFVLGFDSKFGNNRQGTPEALRDMGFEVEVVPKVLVDGRAVSSTVIREAVELGDLARARAMLGRPVSVFGKVVHGANLGRKLGFPTANLDIHHELHPPPGVYACRAHVSAPPDATGRARSFEGVANLGFRPTVAEAGADLQVEVHLFEFEGDLYGKRIELEFVARLRAEQRFSGIDELSAQIREDVRRAREILRGAPPT